MADKLGQYDSLIIQFQALPDYQILWRLCEICLFYYFLLCPLYLHVHHGWIWSTSSITVQKIYIYIHLLPELMLTYSTVNWTLKNNLHRKFYQNTNKNLLQENVFENIVKKCPFCPGLNVLSTNNALYYKNTTVLPAYTGWCLLCVDPSRWYLPFCQPSRLAIKMDGGGGGWSRGINCSILYGCCLGMAASLWYKVCEVGGDIKAMA